MSAQDTASMSSNLWSSWRRLKVALTTSKTQTPAGAIGPTLLLGPNSALARDALDVNDHWRRNLSTAQWAS